MTWEQIGIIGGVVVAIGTAILAWRDVQNHRTSSMKERDKRIEEETRERLERQKLKQEIGRASCRERVSSPV